MTRAVTKKRPTSRPGFALSLQMADGRPLDAHLPVIYIGLTRESVIRQYAESDGWRSGDDDDDVWHLEVRQALAAGDYEAALAGMASFHRGWYHIEIQPVLLPVEGGDA